jgi:hypothetical protein
MTRPRLLDLFCGAGGAAVGYHRAGFDVVGVDLNPQPRYPYEFRQADALNYPLDGFDAIHASPPCQAFTAYRRRGNGVGDGYPVLITRTRTRLAATGRPYIIENVPGAPLDSSNPTSPSKRRHATTHGKPLATRPPPTAPTSVAPSKSASGASPSKRNAPLWVSIG